jgi:hypothetical protein
MKPRRIIPVAMAMLLFGAVTVFASSIWGEFEGYSKVKLVVNGNEIVVNDGDVPPFMIRDKVMVPAQALSDALDSVVSYDSQAMTMNVYHPDVHIFVAKDVGSDYSIKQAFGKVKKGDKVDFVVFAQVENLQTKINSFKISIEAPSGIDAVEPHVEAMSLAKDSFWFPWPFSVRFDEEGSYKVKFSVKLDESSNYTVVSEKTIVSE